MSDLVEFFTLGKLPKGYQLAWRQLVGVHAASRRAFLTPTFCNAVAAVGVDVRMLTVSRDGRVLGVLPLQMKPGIMGSMGIAERVGGEMSDYFGVVGDAELNIDACELLQRSGIAVLEFSHLDETQAVFGLTGESPRVGLCIDIGASGEEYWHTLRKAAKEHVVVTERRARKLAREHGALTFELQSSRAREDLEELIRLKLSQYTRTRLQHAPLFQEANANLLRRLLTVSDPECRGLLSVLRSGERLVAAHFGLCCFDTLHQWFPVYDPLFQAYSPGRLLLMHMLLQGPAAGIRVIDLGEGDAPYKRDYANREHLYFKGVWSAGGVRGLFGRVALSMAWRLNLYQK